VNNNPDTDGSFRLRLCCAIGNNRTVNECYETIYPVVSGSGRPTMTANRFYYISLRV
jgi:hypothetical protein